MIKRNSSKKECNDGLLFDLIGSFWNNNKELPDPDLKIRLDELNSRILWLEDVIDWNNCSSIIKFIERVNREAEETGDFSPITLNLFSPGGELQVTFCLYSLIKNSRVPVNTVNYGACHSGAFIIFLAGQKRTMLPFATFIAHQGSANLGGTYKMTKASMVQYEKEVEAMQSIIVENSLFEMEEIVKKFEEVEDFHIDYEIAKEKGIINAEFSSIGGTV